MVGRDDPKGQLTPEERLLELEVRTGSTLDQDLLRRQLTYSEWQAKAASSEYKAIQKKLAEKSNGVTATETAPHETSSAPPTSPPHEVAVAQPLTPPENSSAASPPARRPWNNPFPGNNQFTLGFSLAAIVLLMIPLLLILGRRKSS